MLRSRRELKRGLSDRSNDQRKGGKKAIGTGTHRLCLAPPVLPPHPVAATVLFLFSLPSDFSCGVCLVSPAAALLLSSSLRGLAALVSIALPSLSHPSPPPAARSSRVPVCSPCRVTLSSLFSLGAPLPLLLALSLALLPRVFLLSLFSLHASHPHPCGAAQTHAHARQHRYSSLYAPPLCFSFCLLFGLQKHLHRNAVCCHTVCRPREVCYPFHSSPDLLPPSPTLVSACVPAFTLSCSACRVREGMPLVLFPAFSIGRHALSSIFPSLVCCYFTTGCR